MGEPLSPAKRLAALERLRLKTEEELRTLMQSGAPEESRLIDVEDELTAIAVASDDARRERGP